MAGTGASSPDVISVPALRQLLVILATAVLAIGCGRAATGETLLDRYITRLSNTVGVERQEAPVIDPPRVIDYGITPMPVETQSIALIDLLSVTQCELKVNIARRNTLLAKNASDSQQLLLDLEFLRLAPACVTSLAASGDDELANTIKKTYELRQHQLPRRIYNAVIAGSEWREFWSVPMALGDYPNQSSDDEAQALNALAHRIERWLTGDWDKDDETIELSLSQLRTGAGGSLLLAASTQSGYLEQASDIIDSTSSSELCRLGKPTETALILNTVVTKYFAGEVQGWLSRVNQRHYALLRGVEAIEASLASELSPDYQSWQRARLRTTSSLLDAPRAHVETIKRARDAC